MDLKLAAAGPVSRETVSTRWRTSARDVDRSVFSRLALESRQAEIKVDLSTLDMRAIDRDELARALETFDPIWNVLLTPERERVLQLLIERIDYDGCTAKLDITWRLAGFGQLVEEIGS